MVDLKERIDLFKDELSLIGTPVIKEFIISCLEKAPDYVFYDCPSSSSGKYHPLDELAGDGTVLHTKKVFAVAYDLTRALDCEHHRDEVLAACILHDITKQGLEKSGHTVKDHPQIAAQLVADVYKDKFKDKMDRNSAVLIYYGVYYHYGLWTNKKVAKPLPQYTPEELCVYLADYIASKRFVEVDPAYKFTNGI
ncbi:MAG: hypothetical protein DRO67_06770 [Candidatus Asgardarchaeum californiense]|nr:MAG: hypothetical protein DRO67_06770 [Candidatus Asgardarchaeum californiense]